MCSLPHLVIPTVPCFYLTCMQCLVFRGPLVVFLCVPQEEKRQRELVTLVHVLCVGVVGARYGTFIQRA